MGQFRGLARSYVQDTPDILAERAPSRHLRRRPPTYMATRRSHRPARRSSGSVTALFTGDIRCSVTSAAAAILRGRRLLRHAALAEAPVRPPTATTRYLPWSRGHFHA
ncbi:MAG: hypothetical protein ACLR4Z_01775 [Butyricicoccaceae bacterium]